jgi:hypothetical protein
VWALSHTHAADQGLRNWFFAERGLTYWSTYNRRAHGNIVAPTQSRLALEWG